MIEIDNLLTDEVVWVYSGQVGHCCCGCAGKYSYNSKSRTLGKKRGYLIADADVNDTEVKRILQLMQEDAAAPQVHGGASGCRRATTRRTRS